MPILGARASGNVHVGDAFTQIALPVLPELACSVRLELFAHTHTQPAWLVGTGRIRLPPLPKGTMPGVNREVDTTEQAVTDAIGPSGDWLWDDAAGHVDARRQLLRPQLFFIWRKPARTERVISEKATSLTW